MPDQVPQFIHSANYPLHKLQKLAQIPDDVWDLLMELFLDCEKDMVEAITNPGVDAARTEYLRGVVYLARLGQSIRAQAREWVRKLGA